jgi:transcription elongation factor GreA
VTGDRQPHADGQWLHLLRNLEGLGLRIWWAETDAPEESLDAFHDAFGEGRIAPPSRPADALALPWANPRRPPGERQVTGITGSVLPEPPRTPEPERRVVELEPGDADGARGEERGTGTTRRAPATPRAHAPVVRPLRASTTPPPSAAPRVATSTSRSGRAAGPAPEPVLVSRPALERMHGELDELTRVKRPEVVLRIKTAREHGDLKENAEYHAAREEQSFLEGRVLALEDRIRRAVVVDEVATGKVMIGSTVVVENLGDEMTYSIVGSTDANPALGRLSSVSPVGAALLGAVAGASVDVKTPRGIVSYKVLKVD